MVLTKTRGGLRTDGLAVRKTAWVAAAAIAVQCAHFVEEWMTGFNCRFPELLGLAPWSIELWATFNLVWIAIWVLAVFGVLRGLRVALFPIWFLTVASVANCVAHPLLALAAGGYFPGLWTSPITGVSGVALLRSLANSTAHERSGGQVA